MMQEIWCAVISSVTLPEDFLKIYVTFDLDGLDPSVLPATGTPVPGGLGYYQALDLVASSLQGRRCVGIDRDGIGSDRGPTGQRFHRRADYLLFDVFVPIGALGKICLFFKEGKFALGAGGTSRACWEHIRREDDEYIVPNTVILAFGWLKKR